MSVNIKISNLDSHQRDGGPQLIRLASNPIRIIGGRHFIEKLTVLFSQELCRGAAESRKSTELVCWLVCEHHEIDSKLVQ